MRQQSTDDVIPGRGEAEVSGSMHLVVGVAILRSRVLEAVVKRVQVRTGRRTRCWLRRRRWESVRANAGYREGATETLMEGATGVCHISHFDRPAPARSRRPPHISCAP